MCGFCFAGYWEDRGIDPVLFQAQLLADRRSLMVDCYQKTRVAQAEDVWMSGLLHAQIDDDNYDVGGGTKESRDVWRAKWLVDHGEPWNGPNSATIEEEDAACDAWELLTVDERAIVVAWRVFPDYGSEFVPPEVGT